MIVDLFNVIWRGPKRFLELSISVTMVTRSVAMETEVTRDWFLQISADLVQRFSLWPLHGSSWNFTMRRDPKSTGKNKVFSAWNLVVSMETLKLRFSEHKFNCLIQGQFPTNFGIKWVNGRPWKDILSMGTKSHVTSCRGHYEEFCWFLYFGPLWTYI